MLGEEKQAVELGADERTEIEAAQADVARSIQVMKDLIIKAVGESEDKLGDDGATAFSVPGTLIVHGPEYCYVYDGPAGVCRPCTAEEERGIEQVIPKVLPE